MWLFQCIYLYGILSGIKANLSRFNEKGPRLAGGKKPSIQDECVLTQYFKMSE